MGYLSEKDLDEIGGAVRILPISSDEIDDIEQYVFDCGKASEYEAFLKGKQTPEETAKMFEALEKYCAQDTYAMVKLMEVLYQYAEK